MTSNISPGLDRRTKRTVFEEALFRPRGAVILATTLVLSFVFPSYWWIIIAVGVVVWGISFIETMRNSKIRTKAMAHIVARDFKTEEAKPEFEAGEIEIVLDTLVDSIRNRVPDDILVTVESIKDTLFKILPQISDVNGSDYNIYTIRQIALDYLPETLENYLALSADLATTKPVKGGKTAHQLLLEQLELLDTQLKEILEDIHRQDTQRLLVHGRFLREKFGKTELWLQD